MSATTPTAQEVYLHTVQALPFEERLRLAALILGALIEPNISITDSNDHWNEQDQSDLATFALQYAATRYPEDEELI